MTTAPALPTQRPILQHRLSTSVALHLLPGVAVTLGYLAVGPRLHEAGIPPEVGVLLAFVVVMAPVTVWHLRRAARRGETPVAYRGRLTRRQAWLWVPLLTLWSFLAWALITPLEHALSAVWLAWLPDWFHGLSAGPAAYSPNGLRFALGISLVVNGLLAPVVEEVYFRGYLMPRLGRLGAWAPVASTVLFTVYHFWQPMNLLKIAVAMLPWIYVTWRIQRLRVAIAVHMAINLLGVVSSFALLSGR